MANMRTEIRREWLTEKEAAEYIKFSKKDLETLRVQGRLDKKNICGKPPVFLLGGSYRYEKHELDEWLLSHPM